MKRLFPLALIALSGCALGPHDPQAHPSLPPGAGGNAALTPIAPSAGPAQAIDVGTPVPAQWWRGFGSPALDALVDRALANNNDIQTADAALRQAHELVRVANAAGMPQLDASYQAQRARTSAALSNVLADPNVSLYTLHTAQLNVSYALDLFGGNRSRQLSARAAADVARYHLAAARTSVIANLVQAVIQQASLVEQVNAAETSVKVNRDILVLMRKRQAIGAVGAADVATQETAVAAAEEALPPLRRALAHQQALIAALIGVAPGVPLPELPGFAELKLPADLPASLPSDLVRQRPDILAAAAQMQGAAADVGTAIAARLPNIQLSANVGGMATRFADMFSSGNPFWALIGGVTQPLFHGGALHHQQKAAEAVLEGSKSQYRATVIQAFVDVSDALTGLHSDADALDAAARADDAATRALGFVRRQLELGDVGTLALLNATTASAQARGQLIQARAARLTDTVALYQAMGAASDQGASH